MYIQILASANKDVSVPLSVLLVTEGMAPVPIGRRLFWPLLLCTAFNGENIFSIHHRNSITTTLYRDNIFATSYWSGTKFLPKLHFLSANKCVKRETKVALSFPIKVNLRHTIAYAANYAVSCLHPGQSNLNFKGKTRLIWNVFLKIGWTRIIISQFTDIIPWHSSEQVVHLCKIPRL